MKKHNFTNRFNTVTTRPFRNEYYVDIQIDSKDKNVIPYAINMIVEPQIEKYIKIYKEDYENEA